MDCQERTCFPLLEDLLNQVHEGKTKEAEETQAKIKQFANGLDDRSYAKKILNAAMAILSGHFPPKDMDFKYPAKLDNSERIIQTANNISLDRLFLDFRNKWGITDLLTSAQMRTMFSRHRYGQQDLDDTGQIRDLLAQAVLKYKQLALDADVQKLSKIKYRNGLREAIYKLADQMTDAE